jgi:anti-sigma factor RsiW
MNVPREVILDLLPLYVAGEASPASRRLVEEYLAQDPELAERVRVLGAEGFVPLATTDLDPDVELRSLRRTRRLLRWQRWLFAIGVSCIALLFSFRMAFEGGKLTRFGFLLWDYPWAFGPLLLIGAAAWIAYFTLGRSRR